MLDFVLFSRPRWAPHLFIPARYDLADGVVPCRSSHVIILESFPRSVETLLLLRAFWRRVLANLSVVVEWLKVMCC